MNIRKNINWVCIFILILLIVLYALSFTKLSPANAGLKDSRKPLKTALINPKYKDTITTFEISQGNKTIILNKEGMFWHVYENEITDSKMPADSKMINNFINDLIKIRNMYKISDSFNKNSYYGLTDNSEIKIKYWLNHESGNELILGNQDFAKTSRYLMTGKSTSIYEIDTSLDKYLITEISSWSDNYLVSKEYTKNIYNAGEIQNIIIKNYNDSKTKSINSSSELFAEISSKLLDLRQSNTKEIFNEEKSVLELTLEFGDKSVVIINIIKTDNDSVFKVISQYNLSLINETKISESKISLWTYNKIKEMML